MVESESGGWNGRESARRVPASGIAAGCTVTFAVAGHQGPRLPPCARAATAVSLTQYIDENQRFGGRTRIRTLDPLIKSQLLYQLSYAP